MLQLTNLYISFKKSAVRKLYNRLIDHDRNTEGRHQEREMIEKQYFLLE